jgi:hypothetical protein
VSSPFGCVAVHVLYINDALLFGNYFSMFSIAIFLLFLLMPAGFHIKRSLRVYSKQFIFFCFSITFANFLILLSVRLAAIYFPHENVIFVTEMFDYLLTTEFNEVQRVKYLHGYNPGAVVDSCGIILMFLCYFVGLISLCTLNDRF